MLHHCELIAHVFPAIPVPIINVSETFSVDQCRRDNPCLPRTRRQICCLQVNAAARHGEHILEHTWLLQHGECNKARCNKARTTTLAYCDDNAGGDQNGNDRAVAHDAGFPGAGHTDTYGDDDADGDNMWQWLG